MPRFSTDLDRGDQLAGSIVALADRAGATAVDSIFEAVRACSAGDTPAAAEHTRRLAVDAGVATGEIAWLATELDAATADSDLIDSAGIAIAGLQSSLLSIAGAVQEIAGDKNSAVTLRLAALQLDELLPAYQPRP
jgi:hypothetical protein